MVSTTRLLKLFHMDLFKPIKMTSFDSKYFRFVIINDFSWYIWILFLAYKDKAFELVLKFFKKITTKKDSNILKIRSDHSTEFENYDCKKF